MEESYSATVQVKDNLMATVSHEMRTPLHGIIGSVELLNKESGQLGHGQRELLQNVTHCASVLHLLINNVLISGAPRGENSLVKSCASSGAWSTTAYSNDAQQYPP